MWMQGREAERDAEDGSSWRPSCRRRGKQMRPSGSLQLTHADRPTPSSLTHARLPIVTTHHLSLSSTQRVLERSIRRSSIQLTHPSDGSRYSDADRSEACSCAPTLCKGQPAASSLPSPHRTPLFAILCTTVDVAISRRHTQGKLRQLGSGKGDEGSDGYRERSRSTAAQGAKSRRASRACGHRVESVSSC